MVLPSLRLAQSADRFVGQFPVGVSIIGNVGRFVSSAAWKLRHVGFVVEQSFLASHLRTIFRKGVGDRLPAKVRDAPRGRVLVVAVADVKDFAEAFGSIAVPHKILRQRDGVRGGHAKIRAEVINAQARWAHACHQRVP
jgi:hypothetical protein